MTYYASDRSLSLETRGAAAALLSVGKTTFTVQDIRDAGASKATAYRILGELRANGYVEKGGGHTWQWLKSYPVSGNPEIRKTGNRTTYIDHDLRDSRSVVAVSDFPENEHDFNHSSDDAPEPPTQHPLIGLPEAPITPVPPPPSSPEKPKRSRTEASAEVKALYPAAFDLTRAPSKGGLAMATRNLCRDLHREFGATGEQLAAFWEYFRTVTPAAQQAAREQRGVNRPSPKQVYNGWRDFLAWWEARRAQAVRDEAQHETRRELSDEERERARAVADAVRKRGFLYNTASGDRAPPVVMAAAGRAR